MTDEAQRPVGPLVRPRTIGPLGAPDPVTGLVAAVVVPDQAAEEVAIAPPLEGLTDPQWQPPTGSVPVIDLDGDLDPDIWTTDDADEAAEDHPQGDGDGHHDLVPDAAQEAAPSRLLRANALVASGTAVSRLTGLVRTSLILVLLGKGLNDAYVQANNTPNMIYELILGGILTAALVPLFTDDLEKGDGQEGTSAIISFALVALVVVSLAALLVAPGLIHLFATGAPEGQRDEYIHAGVFLSLLFAPQIFFYGLMAVWSAVLNSRHRFMAAAWAPVLNNVIAIATLILAARVAGGSPTLQGALDDPQILWILGVGTTLGIATMALALYPAIRRAGVRLHFKFQLQHPAVKRTIRLSGWTFGYVVANMIAVVVVQILAKPSTGDPTRYTTAYQWFQLPHALLAVSIMVTFEPLLGRADARGDRRGFNDQLLLGFRLIGLLIIPAAVGYLALPKGLDTRTFVATGQLGKALGLTGIIAAFAVGLPGFSTYLYSLRGFYAMKDTKTPFLINVVENAINIAAAVVFVRIWGVVGLALAFSLAYTISAGLSVGVLTRHSPGFDWSGLVRTWCKLLLAALVMGAFVYGVVSLIAPSSPAMLIPAILAGVAVGVVIYFACIYVLGVPGISEVLSRLRRRRVP